MHSPDAGPVLLLESVSLENPFYYLELVFLQIVSSENPAYDLEFVYLANPEAATSSKPHSPLRHHLNTALTPMMMMMKTKMLMMKTIMLMMKTKIPSEMEGGSNALGGMRGMAGL